MSGADDATLETTPRRRWLFAPLIVFLILAGLFLVRLFAGDPSTLPSAMIGKPAPRLDLPALEGLAREGRPVPGLAATDLADGRVTILNVFASWCAPCRDEHPFLMELATDVRVTDGAVRIVGLNYKDQPDNARRFLGALGNPYGAVGVDPSGRAGIEWGVYGVPETFVVDGRGIVRFKHVGPLTPAAMPGFLAAITDAARR